MTYDVTYDFLLTFHSNHGPISHRFRDRRRFQSKNSQFSHHLCILRPYCPSSPSNWVSAQRVRKKTRIMWLLGRDRNVTISLAVWIQYTNVTDRRTDRHRTTAKRALMHSVARENWLVDRYLLATGITWRKISVSYPAPVMGENQLKSQCQTPHFVYQWI